jgi:hypothetical protein
MAMDSPRQYSNAATERDGVVSRVALQLRQFLCGLHGHDSLLHFERGRISLLCTSCGHESPGWEVKAAPSRPETADVKSRVVRMPLIRERRVA